MKVSRYDGQELRLVLTGMVTDQTVCSRISAMRKNGEALFNHLWADTVAGICTDYMKKYDQPPNGNMEQLFKNWAEKNTADKNTIEMIERFLDYMSREYEKDSPKSSKFILDVAGRYFNSTKLRKTISEAEEELRTGDWERAREMLVNLQKVELGKGSIVELDQDFEPWRRAYEGEGRGLITYPGDAGDFFGDSLSRDSLYAFMGVDKSGKSFWLLDLAYRAVREKRRVVYFEAGDMGEEDTIMRLAQRIQGRPEREEEIDYPVGFDDEMNPIIEERLFPELTIQVAYKRLRKYTQNKNKFKLSCHSNSSLSVEMISSYLKELSREDWIPDVVVIDYADILAPPTGIRDPLDQIDSIWKHLRRLSQEYHCLVVTATQTSAAAYGNEGVLTRRHFSGRKTKLAHVNGMVGLNVTPEDKEKGISRLNWVVRRRGKWSENRQLYVAGNLSIGRPLIVSSWKLRRDQQELGEQNV